MIFWTACRCDYNEIDAQDFTSRNGFFLERSALWRLMIVIYYRHPLEEMGWFTNLEPNEKIRVFRQSVCSVRLEYSVVRLKIMPFGSLDKNSPDDVLRALIIKTYTGFSNVRPAPLRVIYGLFFLGSYRLIKYFGNPSPSDLMSLADRDSTAVYENI